MRLAIGVTENPWALTGADLSQAREVGLADAAILHAVLQSCLFGHFNRIADAVGVELDYPDRFGAPHIEAATPPYLWPDVRPDQAASRTVDIANWPGARDLANAWEQYALERDNPLTRHQRAVVAGAVASRLGDSMRAAVEPESALDTALVELADIVTLAPWRLGPDAYARVRDLGLSSDADVFDAVATASSAGVMSRMRVSLAALARP